MAVEDLKERNGTSHFFGRVIRISVPRDAGSEFLSDSLRARPGTRMVFCLSSDFREDRQLFWYSLLVDAAAVGSDFAVVTPDGPTAEAARSVGTPILPACFLASLIPWRSPRPSPPMPKHPGEVKPPRTNRIRPPGRTRLPKSASALARPSVHWWQPILWLLILAGVVWSVRFLAITFVPSAVVTLVPAPAPVSAEINIGAGPFVKAVDALHNEVPARTVELRVEGEAIIHTTGQKEVPDTLAKGVVTFRNREAQEITIPVGTVVSASTGKEIRFRTTTTGTLPAVIGADTEVPIEAAEPGVQGNVPAGVISRVEGPLALSVWVINPAPTSGGTNRLAPVATVQDKERLKVLLESKLEDKALSLLREKLKKGEFMPKGTISTQTLTETYDYFAGEVTDRLTLHMRLLARGLAVDGDGADFLVRRRLMGKVPQSANLIPASVRIERSEAEVQRDGSVRFREVATGKMVRAIDEMAVRQQVRGKRVEEAKRILKEQWPLAEEPEIQLEPDWQDAIPRFPYRIQVRVVWKAD